MLAEACPDRTGQVWYLPEHCVEYELVIHLQLLLIEGKYIVITPKVIKFIFR